MKTKGMYFVVRVALISFVLLISSCGTCLSPEDESFSFNRIDYTGNQLRIDGYYYTEYPANIKSHLKVYFLYKNGIMLNAGGFDKIEDSTYELLFQEPGFQSGIQGRKYLWGAFKIEDNKIQFENWSPSEGALLAFNNSGDILNDTTFHITKLTRASGGFIRALDDTYHLKRFSPKPDSTNKFVK